MIPQGEEQRMTKSTLVAQEDRMNRARRKFLKLSASAVSAASCGAFFQTSAMAEGVVKIGIVNSLSGFLAAPGDEMQKGIDLYVVMYPGISSAYGHKLVQYLDAAQIKHLDYFDLFDRNDERFVIIGDGHPTAYANEVLAQKLCRDLGISLGH
jgi:hypothetical protein